MATEIEKISRLQTKPLSLASKTRKNIIKRKCKQFAQLYKHKIVNIYFTLMLTVRPKFKDRNMQTFVVVRSGSTVRLHISFEVLYSEVHGTTCEALKRHYHTF